MRADYLVEVEVCEGHFLLQEVVAMLLGFLQKLHVLARGLWLAHLLKLSLIIFYQVLRLI